MREWWRAWLRGEKRVVKGKNLRGRIYESRTGIFSRLWRWLFGTSISGGEIKGKAEPIGSISIRVYRKATDTWEDHGVVSKGPINVDTGKIQEES